MPVYLNAPFMSIPENCEILSTQLTQRLKRAGFRVFRSFDLQKIREVQPSSWVADDDKTSRDGQMIVLLIHLTNGEPPTLIIHGQDGMSHLGWGYEPTAPDEKKMLSIFNDVRAQINNSQRKEMDVGI